MTTKEYLDSLDREVKRLEIREMLENNPVKRGKIGKQKSIKAKLLTNLRRVFNRHSGGYETAAFKEDYKNENDD